jgi:hypothetical protein
MFSSRIQGNKYVQNILFITYKYDYIMSKKLA